MINISFGEHTTHFFIDKHKEEKPHKIKQNLIKVPEKKSNML